MERHEELEGLSAYLDGELAAQERERIERHVGSCASCAETLGALRATLGDLRSLPPAAPSERDSWALRAAIRRERRRARAARLGPFAAAAAVAAIAVVGVMLGGSPERPEVASEIASGPASYDAGGVRELASSLATRLGAAEDAEGPAAQDAPAQPADGAGASRAEAGASALAGSPAAIDHERFEECVAVVTESATDALAPLAYQRASFDGRDAFVLAFAAPAADPARVEVWVLGAEDCSVLFFAQASVG